ncbi:uncharacterized protein LOC141690845 [Apium graveolens]|uniref:uncharacterized protein LOC141690845 n=1 Tax=Apium graveolens TaxID=4045 RepID=UPI003D7944BB
MTNNPSPTIHTPVKWTKPENGVLKLNVDTSVSLGAISFTMGLVIRDHAGVFVAGKMVCIAMITTTFEVEALAILESLHWLLTLNHDRVIIESDSLLSIRALQGSHDNLLEVGSILNACRIILDSRPGYSISFVKRQTNGIAHLVAKLPCSLNCQNVLTSPSNTLLEALLYDIS